MFRYCRTIHKHGLAIDAKTVGVGLAATISCFALVTSPLAQTLPEANPGSAYLQAPIKFEQPGKKPLAPSELAALNSVPVDDNQMQSSNCPAVSSKKNKKQPLPAGSPSSTTKSDELPAAKPDCAESEFVDLAFGAFQRGYYLSAFKLALPRAESGDPAAQTLIAELYDNGQGVALNKKKAASWYQFAAKAGNREAQFAYANILAKGKILPLDKKGASKYMQKAADAGHHKAQFNYAQMIINRKPSYQGFVEARPYYEKAAKGGLADAQYVMARMHATGKGFPHSDLKKARKWMTLAAIGGFDTAQLELAIWMALGKGGPKDEKAALDWFALAANQGNVIAQNRLARMYAFGLGTRPNQIKAATWHILARRAGKTDGELDEIFRNLSSDDQKLAIKTANAWRSK